MNKIISDRIMTDSERLQDAITKAKEHIRFLRETIKSEPHHELVLKELIDDQLGDIVRLIDEYNKTHHAKNHRK